MPKAIKIVLGVLLGLAVWIVVATVGNFVIRASVSGYAEAEPAMTFTLPMLLARLGLGALSSVAAGFVCAAALRSAPNLSFRRPTWPRSLLQHCCPMYSSGFSPSASCPKCRRG